MTRRSRLCSVVMATISHMLGACPFDYAQAPILFLQSLISHIRQSYIRNCYLLVPREKKSRNLGHKSHTFFLLIIFLVIVFISNFYSQEVILIIFTSKNNFNTLFSIFQARWYCNSIFLMRYNEASKKKSVCQSKVINNRKFIFLSSNKCQ